MASWMIHLRIADKLLDAIPGLSPIEFIMGNMAPDSGTPNPTGKGFTPNQTVSHFRLDDGSRKKTLDLEAYLDRYFSPALRKRYDSKQFSFYLGYYTHLLTDVLWTDRFSWPTRQKFPDADRQDIKANLFALDFLYLKKHPGFRAFRAYLGSVGFVNTYMDFFSPDAFDNRRAYITDFYLQENAHIEREYRYLTEAEADAFVKEAVAEILNAIQHGIP